MKHLIYSKIDPAVLLHIIHRHEENKDPIALTRKEALSNSEHYLQAMYLEIPAETIVKPHKHNAQERHTHQTHEGLLVFRGSIELSIYDMDNSFVEKHILQEGDFYMIINGGHSIKTLAPSQLFEFKNGPYYGPEKDKSDIS